MKKFFIKQRNNPQLGIYYVAMGSMSKKESKKYESPLYGFNRMIPYDSEEEYTAAIEKLKAEGEKVQ